MLKSQLTKRGLGPDRFPSAIRKTGSKAPLTRKKKEIASYPLEKKKKALKKGRRGSP